MPGRLGGRLGEPAALLAAVAVSPRRAAEGRVVGAWVAAGSVGVAAGRWLGRVVGWGGGAGKTDGKTDTEGALCIVLA